MGGVPIIGDLPEFNFISICSEKKLMTPCCNTNKIVFVLRINFYFLYVIIKSDCNCFFEVR